MQYFPKNDPESMKHKLNFEFKDKNCAHLTIQNPKEKTTGFLPDMLWKTCKNFRVIRWGILIGKQTMWKNKTLTNT